MHRVLVVLLATCVLASGCASGVTIAVGTFAIATAHVVSTDDAGNLPSPRVIVFGFGGIRVLALEVVVGLGGIIGMANHPKPTPR